MNSFFIKPFLKFFITVLATQIFLNPSYANTELKKQTAASENLTIHLDVKKIILPNKLTVLLLEDHSAPLISYHTWYKVGSRDESKGITGSAHMLEHMMFQGAKKYSGKESQKILQKHGIEWNAFTSSDYTGFYMNLPSDKLDLIMDIEFDRMSSLKIAEENLKSELEVVKEERRMRVDNNPMGLLYEKTMGTIFQTSNYSWPVIGWMEDITNYKTSTLRDFYNRYYGPNNAVLVIAGDFDLSKTEEKIRKIYGALPQREVGKRSYPPEADQLQPRLAVVNKDIQAKSFNLTFPTVGENLDIAKERYALDILASILGMGGSSRLYQVLVYEKKLAISASAYHRLLATQGMFNFSVQLNPKISEKTVLPVLISEIEKIKSNGVSKIDLKKAKNYVMKSATDSMMTLDRKARVLAESEITTGDYKTIFEDLNEYQKVTIQQIQAVAIKYLNLNRKNLVVLEPISTEVKKDEK